MLGPLTGHGEADFSRRAGNETREPCEAIYRLPALKLPAFAREGQRINHVAISRHKRGMIVSSPSRVKAPFCLRQRARNDDPMRLILASTSAYRRELLTRLELPFEVARPEVDETPEPGETPVALAERLALAKAQALAAREPDALIIGSDQVAYLGDEIFGKPGTVERAVAQLQRMRGQAVVFHTAVALLNTRSGQTRSAACRPRCASAT